MATFLLDIGGYIIGLSTRSSIAHHRARRGILCLSAREISIFAAAMRVRIFVRGLAFRDINARQGVARVTYKWRGCTAGTHLLCGLNDDTLA